VPTKWFAEGEQPEYNQKTSACKQVEVFLQNIIFVVRNIIFVFI